MNMACCFILDGFLVAEQLLEWFVVCNILLKGFVNTEELIKTMVGQKLECNVVKILI